MDERTIRLMLADIFSIVDGYSNLDDVNLAELANQCLPIVKEYVEDYK